MARERSRIQVSIMAGALVAVALALLLPKAAAASEDDYSPWSSGWNGLSTLMSTLEATELPVRFVRAPNLDEIDPSVILFLIYPTSPPPGDELRRFLAAGGTVVIADDFGASDAFLSEIGVEKLPASGLSLPTKSVYRKKASMPFAEPLVADHPLARGVERLVTNHPVFFRSEFLPVFGLGHESRGVVLSLTVGPGRLILISDASIFINLMLGFPDNRRFLANLVVFVASTPGSRFWVISQRAEWSGTFTPPPDLESTGADRKESSLFAPAVRALQSMLREWNEYRIDPRVFIYLHIGLWAILFILSAVHLRHFLARRISYDGSWTSAGEPPPTGRFHERMGRYLNASAKDYMEAACIMRDQLDHELAWRLRAASPLTLLNGRDGERLVKRHYGGDAARMYRELHSMTRGLPPTDKLRARPGLRRRFAYKRLERLDELATRLLDILGRTPLPSDPPSPETSG